jgi:hypothetical protein
VIERSYAQAEARASAELTAARAALAELLAATDGRVEELETAVSSGYREGYRSAIELIDAARAKTEVALRTLELKLAVKRAEVALRAARGQLEGGKR